MGAFSDRVPGFKTCVSQSCVSQSCASQSGDQTGLDDSGLGQVDSDKWTRTSGPEKVDWKNSSLIFYFMRSHYDGINE
jgi:hypothetical protein